MNNEKNDKVINEIYQLKQENENINKKGQVLLLKKKKN